MTPLASAARVIQRVKSGGSSVELRSFFSLLMYFMDQWRCLRIGNSPAFTKGIPPFPFSHPEIASAYHPLPLLAFPLRQILCSTFQAVRE